MTKSGYPRSVDESRSDDSPGLRRGTWRAVRVPPLLVDIPTLSGHSLSAHRFPSSSSPAPAVVLFTPYRKEGAWLTYPDFATFEDYEVVVVDVRATGGSGGAFEGPLSAQEIDDAVDALAWIAAQAFCDGRTALIGSSYSGITQYLIAARNPPSLVCIAPSIAPVDNYRDMTHRGGIPTTAAWYASTYGGAGRPDTLRLGLLQGLHDTTDPFDGPLPQSRSATAPLLRRITVPTLCLGGLYDIFSAATIAAFHELTSLRRLVLGDWGHETQMSTTEKHELSRWLGYWLRDEGSDPTEGFNVLLHRAGDHTWQESTAWPTTGGSDWITHQLVAAPTHTPVVVLLEAVPSPTSATGSDPAIDALIDSGMRLWGESWTTQTGRFEATTDLRGPSILTIDLLVEECADIDLHARLSLVRNDRSIEQLVEGRLRASHRDYDNRLSIRDQDGLVIVPWRHHASHQPLDSAATTRLLLNLAPLNLRVAPGEHLQVGLTLVRADGVVAPATVVLLPSSTVRLPLAAPTDT